MKQETKLENNYWVVGSNKWNANIYTKEQAEKYAENLVNCNNCTNCSNCINCHDCSDCSYCDNCSNCINCHDCSDCSYCDNCSYCSDCSDCSYCSGCSDCSYCSGFKTNPQRITSPLLGRRNSHSTYYFTIEHEQVVCGCFKGTLEEFEAKVKETHGENEFAKGYLKWIDAVKIFKLTYGGNK